MIALKWIMTELISRPLIPISIILFTSSKTHIRGYRRPIKNKFIIISLLVLLMSLLRVVRLRPATIGHNTLPTIKRISLNIVIISTAIHSLFSTASHVLPRKSLVYWIYQWVCNSSKKTFSFRSLIGAIIK